MANLKSRWVNRHARAALGPLVCGRFWIEFAQERRKFFLLRFVESVENFRNASFKLRDGTLVQLRAFVGEYDVNHAAVGFIAFAYHELLVLKPIDDAGCFCRFHSPPYSSGA